jgi:hypothetical protein
MYSHEETSEIIAQFQHRAAALHANIQRGDNAVDPARAGITGMLSNRRYANNLVGRVVRWQ